MAAKNVVLEVLAEKVATFEKELPGMKSDLQAIRQIVTSLQITLATLPTTPLIEQLEQRVRSLEDEKNRASGGLKALIVIGSLVGTLIGWAVSVFARK